MSFEPRGSDSGRRRRACSGAYGVIGDMLTAAIAAAALAGSMAANIRGQMLSRKEGFDIRAQSFISDADDERHE